MKKTILSVALSGFLLCLFFEKLHTLKTKVHILHMIDTNDVSKIDPGGKR